MKRLFNLNHIRLRNKMMIVYILCVFLPVVLTNVVFYQVTSENVKKQKMQDISRALEQMNNEFRAEIDDAVNVSSVFFTDNNLNEILEAEYDNPASYIEAYDSYFRRILNSYTPVYTSVQNIKIYLDNPTLLHSGGIGYLSDEVKELDWYKSLGDRSANRPLLVKSPREDLLVRDGEENSLAAFSIVRRMNYFDSSNKWEKVLKIELKMDSVRHIFANLNVGGTVYLLNGQGTIEYATDDTVERPGKPVDYASVDLPAGTLEFRTAFPVSSYLDGWQIVGRVSEDEVFREVRRSREFVIWLAAINLLASTSIIVWISRSLTARLGTILKHMKRVKNQHFDTIPQEVTRDEIGQLTGEFNRMTLQIESLINDVYVADIQKKSLELERQKAQLNALQSQINPHFLFNALETIRMRSVIKKETETAKIIQNMAKLFRSSLTWNKDKVTVNEEADFINCFLEIQKYRFGDRLNYEVSIRPDAGACLIPKLVFLPFVENACMHGIEQLKQGGDVDLRIGREGDFLVFAIRDNGIGMQAEQVRKFHRYMEKDEELGERIGVQNVIYRLKMIYGHRFRFDLESEPGRGTSVQIAIPVEAGGHEL
ncbi:cache domain-containing sensor histidine kinase [Paenibacillus arenilitoris]|uniref:Sensor histidine kinase n=1 Tax=Paenibacillus arenilitoris TaxID=2772299 RepID=A0A927H8P8_9BACL|nr:sensor histidine kinase [Paenibacillus arenilitoris]MBD2870829.1 sensor histidine kinase [Paenibacillus arenilitoris]